MPGVDVLTDIISGPAALSRSPGSSYFVPTQAERGPTDRAVEIHSLAEYEYHYGERVSYGAGYDDLATFFGEGGGRAFVARVVGAAPVLATRTLMDRAGAPLATVRIDAKDAGAWANAITVTVANGVPANSFTITISGTPDGKDEVFADHLNPQAAVDAINATSRWVKATNLGSASAPPQNNPAILAATALAGGTDDRASIVAASYTTAADALFGKELGAGAIAVPGQPSSAVGAALINHARTRDRLAILATVAAQTPTQAKTAAAALKGTLGSEGAGIFYPWVKVPDGAGSTRTISPEGYVAGARARAHDNVGPWRAGAGAMSQANYVMGLERELTRAEGNDLDDNNVNAIRTIARTTRIYGWRSLSADAANWRFLTYRDVMNDIEVKAEQVLEAYPFRPIDAKNHAFKDLEADLIGIAAPLKEAGGLFPRLDPNTREELDPGYRVDTGPAVNTAATIAASEIRGLLAVRPSPTGALVTVTVSKAAFAAPL
jgi:hypothetical protein